jgi:hypothetical protein
MSKTIVAIFFSVLFSVLTVAPNILAIIDNDYDLSILIDSSEEEEKKGEEKDKDIKIEIPSNNNVEYAIYNNLAGLLSAHKENYNSLFKELTSPPPEQSIL